MKTRLWNTHFREKVTFQAGDGSFLFKSRILFFKEKYLDFSAGGGVNSLGYKNKELLSTIKKWAQKGIWHLSNYYENPLAEKYAKKLCNLSGFETAFFTNSGTESNEAAIKLVRKYFEGSGKNEIIALEKAFHGRTMGSLSATFNIKYRKGFEPFLPGFIFSPPDLKIIESLITPKTAAIIIEPIQGEGGINYFSPDFLEELYHLTRKHSLLLIFDEVQTGFGRTGMLFAFQHTGIIPDVLTLAKGIAGGFPFGAVLTRKDISDSIQTGMHGGTFGGNLLALACALKTLEIISSSLFLENIRISSEALEEGLNNIATKYPSTIKSVRGVGLMRGIELSENINSLDFKNRAFKKQKLLLSCAGDNVIRITPPLVIKLGEVKSGLRKLEKLLLTSL